MKKIILAVLVALASINGNAQEKSAFEKDTYTLIEMITKPTVAPLISQLTVAMVVSEKHADFLKEVDKSLPELYKAISKTYMEEFSHEDIKGMIKFYNSPLGQKVISKQGSMVQKNMMAGQSWGIKLQAIAQKYQIKHSEAGNLEVLEQQK